MLAHLAGWATEESCDHAPRFLGFSVSEPEPPRNRPTEQLLHRPAAVARRCPLMQSTEVRVRFTAAITVRTFTAANVSPQLSVLPLRPFFESASFLAGLLESQIEKWADSSQAVFCIIKLIIGACQRS